jgi:hypothetical protein
MPKAHPDTVGDYARLPFRPPEVASSFHLLVRPGWRGLPLALLAVALMSALPAAPVALLFGWLLDIQRKDAEDIEGNAYSRKITWMTILALAAMASGISSFISFKLVKFAPVVFIGTPPEKKLAVLTLLLMSGAGPDVICGQVSIALFKKLLREGEGLDRCSANQFGALLRVPHFGRNRLQSNPVLLAFIQQDPKEAR